MTRRSLSPEERAVEADVFRFLEANFDRLVEQYEKDNGRIVDADRIKELFPMFAESESARIQWASAVYAPAARLADYLYEYFLRREGSRFAVVLLAGGPGSGKSTFSSQPEIAKLLSEAAVTMDGTLSDTDRAVRLIESALETGKDVVVFYVHSEFDRAIQGVIDRSVSPTSLRVVPLSVVAAKHFGAVKTLEAISFRFSDVENFAIRIAIFKGLDEPFGEGTVEGAPSAVDPLIERSYSILDARYKTDQDGDSGHGETARYRLTEELYQRLRG